MKRHMKSTAAPIATEEPALGDEFKIFVSRIPAAMDDAAVRRLVTEALSSYTSDSTPHVVSVQLAYDKESTEATTLPRPSAPKDETDRYANRPSKRTKTTMATPTLTQATDTKHKGYGFVTLSSVALVQYALDQVRTIRGGVKPSSTRLYTLYLGPVLSDEQKTTDAPSVGTICFLWTAGRCPYGTGCKFTHAGPGNCVPVAVAVSQKIKCRNYRKGKCPLDAATCPFSHNFEVKPAAPLVRSDADKDCIDWKTKGKCRKLAKQLPCPYRHDPAKQKQGAVATSGQTVAHPVADTACRKVPQPLTVRVFGLNYDTTVAHIQTLFAPCGRIVNVDRPTYSDSGRGKGYCGITFTSPQAVTTAVETLHGTEVDGRWISVQAGKMLLDQWERKRSES